jgi:hypothetical protein
MQEGMQVTTQFVLLAVKRDAGYWTPETIAQELYRQGLIDSASEAEFGAFRDAVLRGLVGRAAERFWASDAVTPTKAAAIRSACQALHDVTLDVLVETAPG